MNHIDDNISVQSKEEEETTASKLTQNHIENGFETDSNGEQQEDLEDEDDEEDIENGAGEMPGIYFENDAVFANHSQRLAGRKAEPELPDTVEVLKTSDGCVVYLVGTAHFSENSQQDVCHIMQSTQPDIVLVELCSSRINILSLDEETLLREAGDINIEKMRLTIKQSGLVQGVLHLLLLSMTAHITKQLGMAPGGEFRAAFREAKKIPGCRVHLGDRPISVTLRRALGSLSWVQKLRLAWYLLTSKDTISKEDVERCKQKDLLEEMLKEMTGEFPALSQVFVAERDVYLANSLHQAAQRLIDPYTRSRFIPSVVVGVVGIGHVPGIVANWNKPSDISSLLTVPPPSTASACVRWAVRSATAGTVLYGCYKMFKFFMFTCASDLLPEAISISR